MFHYVSIGISSILGISYVNPDLTEMRETTASYRRRGIWRTTGGSGNDLCKLHKGLAYLDKRNS